MPDFLEAQLTRIDKRLEELGPLLDEARRLKAARAALSREADTSVATGGLAMRSRQALEMIRDTPGITSREMALSMNIHPNYLYRIMPQIENRSLARREGSHWHLTDAGEDLLAGGEQGDAGSKDGPRSRPSSRSRN